MVAEAGAAEAAAVVEEEAAVAVAVAAVEEEEEEVRWRSPLVVDRQRERRVRRALEA